jgi:hypothetical protein
MSKSAIKETLLVIAMVVAGPWIAFVGIRFFVWSLCLLYTSDAADDYS